MIFFFCIISNSTNRITITTKGKYTAINEGKAIQPLVDLVDDPVSEVRLNAIKVKINQCSYGRENANKM